MELQEKKDYQVQWWLLTVQGIATILFGLAAVFWPGLTLGILIYLFSAYILVTGVVFLIDGILSMGKVRGWILTLVLAIAQVGVGVYLLRNPLTSFAIVIMLIGFSLIISAVVEAVNALASESSATHRGLHLVSALLSLVVGIFILTQPVSGGVTFVWVLGFMALINGPLMIALSVDVKNAEKALR